MSQAKVDKYKDYKKNKKEILAKEKRKQRSSRIITWTIIGVILIGLGTAVGVSIYNQEKARIAAMPDYTDTSLKLMDFSGIRDFGTEEAE